MAQPRRTTGGAAAEGLPTRALMDNKFLMKLAQKNITSPEQLQLGVFLDMKTSSIRDIMRESDDSVTNSFNLLEAWLHSRKSVDNSTALFDELSEACLNLNRADLVNFVRCEQLSQLNEQLRKAKETALPHKKHFNEQMQRVKLEHKETKKQLKKTTRAQQKTAAADLQKTNAELQQTKALPVNRTSREAAANTTAPTEEMIASITAVAKPVRGESDQDKGLRTLRVMSMIQQHGEPELWQQVSRHCVKKGVLSITSLLTSDHLPDFMFLLSSCDVSQIASLQLDYNTVFQEDDALTQLAAAVADMSKLCKLSLCGCGLTDSGLEAIAGGVTEHLTELWVGRNNLTDASDVTVRDLLSHRPRLKISLSLFVSPLWMTRLKAEFPGRFL